VREAEASISSRKDSLIAETKKRVSRAFNLKPAMKDVKEDAVLSNSASGPSTSTNATAAAKKPSSGLTRTRSRENSKKAAKGRWDVIRNHVHKEPEKRSKLLARLKGATDSFLGHQTASTDELLLQRLQHRRDSLAPTAPLMGTLKSGGKSSAFGLLINTDSAHQSMSHTKRARGTHFKEAVKMGVFTVRRWIPFDPTNTTRKLWDMTIFLLLVYCAYQIPYKLASPPEPGGKTDQLYEIMDAFSLGVFGIDIVLNFFTAYSEEGALVTDLKLIQKKYMKSWLLLDLVATLPLDWMLPGSWGIMKAGKLLRILRLLRLFKISSRLESAMNPTIIRLVKLLFFVTVMSHWSACALIIIAKESSDPDVWLAVPDFLEKPKGLQYGIAMYWTFGTMLGDRSSPQDEIAVGFTLLILLVGIVVYSSVFGNLVTLLNNYDLASIEYKEKMDKAALYMRKLKVPDSLRQRINTHYEHMHDHTHGVNVHSFMQDLPRHLRQELAMFLNAKVLDAMSLFDSCSVSFLTAILMRLKLEIFMPGDLLCCEGDIGEEMYLIISGELAVWKKGKHLGTLREGSFFGEGALLHNGDDNAAPVRNASVRAMAHCTLYSLSRDGFVDVAKSFPEDSQVFSKVAGVRQQSGGIVPGVAPRKGSGAGSSSKMVDEIFKSRGSRSPTPLGR